MNRVTARPRRSATARARAFAFGCALIAALTGAALSAHDANRVQAFSVGRGSALAACEGLDSSNDSRARASFPRAAELRYRTRVPGGIGQAPASDEAGNLIVAHGEARLSKLDPQGRSVWSERLPSEASCTPALLSDGSILVVTRDAQALLFRASGALEHAEPLALADPRRRAFAIPTANGGAFLASGTDLLELDAHGELVRQARARAIISAIAESGSGLLAVAETGSVELARATGDFELLGSLGGNAPEGAAVLAGKLLAVVDAHKLVALDLVTGQGQTLATDPVLALSGPPALFEGQGLALVADGGFLSLRTDDGAETLRVSLNASGQAFDAAARGLRPALVISDRSGAIAATRSGSDALLLDSQGNVRRFDGSACLDPFRPTPIRDGVAFTCRSGQVFVVGSTAH